MRPKGVFKTMIKAVLSLVLFCFIFEAEAQFRLGAELLAGYRNSQRLYSNQVIDLILRIDHLQIKYGTDIVSVAPIGSGNWNILQHKSLYSESSIAAVIYNNSFGIKFSFINRNNFEYQPNKHFAKLEAEWMLLSDSEDNFKLIIGFSYMDETRKDGQIGLNMKTGFSPFNNPKNMLIGFKVNRALGLSSSENSGPSFSRLTKLYTEYEFSTELKAAKRLLIGLSYNFRENDAGEIKNESKILIYIKYRAGILPIKFFRNSADAFGLIKSKKNKKHIPELYFEKLALSDEE